MLSSVISKEKSSTGLLVVGFVLMILFNILFAAVSILEYRKIAELNNKIYLHPFTVSNAVLEANADIIAMHRYMKDVVLANDVDSLELAISLVEKHEQSVFNKFSIVEDRFLGNKDKIREAYSVFVDWRPIRNEVISLQRQGQKQLAASITVGKGARHVELLSDKMDVLIDFARDKALEFRSSSQENFDDSVSYQIAFVVVIFLTSSLTACFVVYRVRQSERAQRASEARFEGLYNNSEVSVWSEDFSSIYQYLSALRDHGVIDIREYLTQNPQVVYDLIAMLKVDDINNATLKMFEAETKEKMLGSVDSTFGDNAVSVFVDELCAIWDKKPKFKGEANFKTFSGHEFIAIITFPIPKDESEFKNIPVSIIDITERIKTEQLLHSTIKDLREAQEQLVQSEKLAAIGQLAAGVAHEINNPTGYVGSNMNSLANYVDDLTEMFELIKTKATLLNNYDEIKVILDSVEESYDFEFMKEDLNDLITETKDGVRRIQKIVSDLKGFARASDGEWEWVNLNDEIDSTLNVVWNELKYHCEVEKEYGRLPQIQCLRSELGQVIMNLLVNASQAITDKGTIFVRTAVCGSMVKIEIEDTGAGIEPSHLKKIFDPFFTTKPVGKGTGLGLSVSIGIIEKHQGQLSVESAYGEGSTFSIILPISQPGQNG